MHNLLAAFAYKFKIIQPPIFCYANKYLDSTYYLYRSTDVYLR